MSDLPRKIGLAVIGCGQRSTYVIGNLLNDSGHQVQVLAAYDPDESETQRAIGIWDEKETLVCQNYQQAIQTPGVEWVMIFSPNVFHKEHILAAFAAGKDVFSEKPLATSIEDCQTIFDAHQKSGRKFATGFVLRYSKMYRKVKELLDSGAVGRILSINADENIDPGHGSYIMKNWRRNTAMAGPHILEKCCHDLDLINWFCGSLPTKVAAFGGLDFFVPANEPLRERCIKDTFEGWRDPHMTKESAFCSDKDLFDTQVCIALYRNGIKVQFQATMSNAMPERRMYFSCTEGNIAMELYKMDLEYRSLHEHEAHTIHFGVDMHGGGDKFIMKELFEVMQNGGEPKCSGSEGLESAVFALALDQAMRENRVIDLEPVWKKLCR